MPDDTELRGQGTGDGEQSEDSALLRCYAETGSERAFADLVRRHLNFVYAAALRLVGGDAHLAQDVAQTVFTDLARKAGALAGRPVLTGWLYTSTRFAAAKAVRTARRRQVREQEAHLMQELTRDSVTDGDWARLRPVIDEALQALNERDREAVLLRFFEGHAFPEIGLKLSLDADATRLRVERALEKIRRVLARRGVDSTTAALALALANQPAVAIPAGLAVNITGAALANAAAGGGGIAALLSSLLTMTTTTKIAAATTLVAAMSLGLYFAWSPSATGAAQATDAAARVAAPSTPARLPAKSVLLEPPLAPAIVARPPPASSPVPRPGAAPESVLDPTMLESAKTILAHIGNIAKDGRVQAAQGFDASTVAVVRTWMEQDPQAALQWLATVPPEGNQHMHTLEALIAIETAHDPEVAFLLANSIGLETSRVSRLRDVLRAWAPLDPSAATTAVRSADVSEENRALLLAFVDRESRSRTFPAAPSTDK